MDTLDPRTYNLQGAIAATLAAASAAPTFDPSDYPKHYAWSFVRDHPEVLALDPLEPWKRGDSVRAVLDYVEATGQDLVEVYIALADGYLAEHRIQATTSERIAAMEARGYDAAVLHQRRAALGDLVALSLDAGLDI